MDALIVILSPLLFAAIAFGIPSNRWRPAVLPVAAIVHLYMVLKSIWTVGLVRSGVWLELDPVSRPVILLIAILFLGCSFYAVGYLHHRQERNNRIFCACLLLFLSMMSLVTWAQHWGLMWVAMEATTLSSAPLIYYNRTRHSLEATWKYLLICSVGIALALFGSFFLAYASIYAHATPSLFFTDILEAAPHLSKPWLDAAFVFLVVGYGTKMGLAPMHSWKPDVYGESPGVVGALFSGAMTSCAMLMLLRIYQVCHRAGDDAFVRPLFILVGVLSMGFAAVFVIRQRDFKRMLAYSSVEHMGILALGIGFGGIGLFGSLLHMFNNGLAKGVLFLSAGNIHRAFGSKFTDAVAGALRRVPVSAALLLAGFLAISGSPPFGPFVSEFTILNASVDGGHTVATVLMLVFLLVVFVGMGATVLAVIQGEPSACSRESTYREGFFTCAPIVLLMALVLVLGVYLPPPLRMLLDDAVRFLEASP